MPRIGVDLTPLLPGGVNGGAKVLTVELLRSLFRLEPEWTWILLTNDATEDELRELDGPNRERRCVLRMAAAAAGVAPPAPPGLLRRVSAKIANRLPRRMVAAGKRLVQSLPGNGGEPIARSLGLDVLFCPFTAPTYAAPPIPTLSIFYDLQYHEYPHFFSEAERQERERTFRRTVSLASHVICISEFSRDSLIRHGGIEPERATAIPLALSDRLVRPADSAVDETLKKQGLQRDGYYLYPGNTWAHKNHAMLLLAYSMYLRRSGGKGVPLVLTGAGGGDEETVRAAVRAMGLESQVKSVGFVNEGDLASLLVGCRALLFPSLYEGFGIPVVEAFAFGVPVLCSDRTSLPEVAGEAAILFDPRRPDDIVRAIEEFEASSPGERERRKGLGLARVEALGDLDSMARRYRDVFAGLLGSQAWRDEIEGLHGDGWTGSSFRVTYRQRAEETVLRLSVQGPPPGLGAAPCRLTLKQSGSWRGRRKDFDLRPGENHEAEFPCSADGGAVLGTVRPTFRPIDLGLGEDARDLGCRVRSAVLTAGGEATEIYRRDEP